MKPTRPLPLAWTVRLSNVRLSRPSSTRPEAPPAARPGIGARWKPRDRVSAAGN